MEKDELLRQISSLKKVIIELGCGPNKMKGAIGIDHLPLGGVDFVADLEQGLPFLPDNSIDEIHSRHVLEHVQNFEQLMKDIHRVLKPGGKKIIIVPHFSNPHFYSDYTHKSFFGLYSFDYFSRPQNQLKRKVPSFYLNFHFKVTYRKLKFKSPDFLIRHLFKKHVLQNFFNINSWFQEWYEESFCYIFPCQEIEFVIEPEKNISENGG